MKALLELLPVTQDLFARYGAVVSHKGEEKRHYIPFQPGADEAYLPLCSWVNHITQPLYGDVVEVQLERHPRSDQLFVPLDGQRYLAVVCDDRDGEPDLTTLKAFLVPGNSGILYRHNVWHAGMQVFDAPCHFFVQMARLNDGSDDQFVEHTTTITLNLPAELKV